jgi:hypothetical protein
MSNDDTLQVILIYFIGAQISIKSSAYRQGNTTEYLFNSPSKGRFSLNNKSYKRNSFLFSYLRTVKECS